MNLQEYWILLNSHDWFYEFSNDFSKYTSGSKSYKKLVSLRDQSDEHRRLFDEFEASVFSGEAFDTVKKPKPTMPQE